MTKLEDTLKQIDSFFEFIDTHDGDEVIKRLEDFKLECEAYGVYTGSKSITQLRWDLRQEKIRRGEKP